MQSPDNVKEVVRRRVKVTLAGKSEEGVIRGGTESIAELRLRGERASIGVPWTHLKLVSNQQIRYPR